MFFPKSTKCGDPILTGYPFIPVYLKSGFSGLSGQPVHVRPKSVE